MKNKHSGFPIIVLPIVIRHLQEKVTNSGAMVINCIAMTNIR